MRYSILTKITCIIYILCITLYYTCDLTQFHAWPRSAYKIIIYSYKNVSLFQRINDRMCFLTIMEFTIWFATDTRILQNYLKHLVQYTHHYAITNQLTILSLQAQCGTLN